LAAARTSFADSPHRLHRSESGEPRGIPFRGLLLRRLVAPFAAFGLLAAGALFVILLPICGIASIAQGFAAACWRFLLATTRLGSLSRAARR
jgi:hypothetical protein